MNKNELTLHAQDERISIDGVRVCNRCSEAITGGDASMTVSLVFTTQSGKYAIIQHHHECKPPKDYIPYKYDPIRSHEL